MLEYNHVMQKRVTRTTRLLTVLMTVLCVVFLLSQTVFATNFYVINDGDTILLHASQATDPKDVLTEAGLELDNADSIVTRPGLAVSEIIVTRCQKITVQCGNTAVQLYSYGETVGELLERANITLTEQDTVSVSLESMTFNGQVIFVTNTQVEAETFEAEIPYETVYLYDPSLPEGEQKVMTQGVAGWASYTAEITYVNGFKTDRVITSETVLQPAVNAVMAVGGEAPENAITMTDEVKAAILEAKETGKPVILNGLIVTANGEFFSFGREGVFRATAYHNSDPGCTIWTAIGTLCRVGAIAVDPTVIPYGTEMFIVSNDGRYIYGYAVAEDCGSSIKGNKIDLYFDSVDECNRFGIRDCTVYFLN